MPTQATASTAAQKPVAKRKPAATVQAGARSAGAPARKSRPAAATAPKAAAKTAAAKKPAARKITTDTAADHAKPKAKLVRDSFTMPKADFDLVGVLKERALGFKRPTKKSELLRAGLHALAGLNASALQSALTALTPLKPGRPKKPT